jgi:diguanylate cyclase (GGDEF)-like protein
LLTRRKALSLLRRFVDMASRNSTAASMAVIDLDHFKSVNDSYGHPAGDQVLVKLAELLKGALRSNDVVARWGGEEFVVGVLGLAKQSTANRLRDILESLKKLEFSTADGRNFQVSFSAGVAHFPDDGLAVEDLYKSADEALYEAKRLGRSRVTLASAKESLDLDRYDVVVVEDDSPLAEVITESCRARCLSSIAFENAESFLTAVRDGALQTRILILDFDLPDLDGLEILGELRAIPQHPKVLLLSGKMTEEEILKAHDLGIHEYLPKPVHLSVLMRRVERALNA